MWRYVIADPNGVNVGEPLAAFRTLTVGVSAVEAASCDIRATDQMWQLLAAGTSMLKVFDPSGALRFYGPIISDEEVGSGQTTTTGSISSPTSALSKAPGAQGAVVKIVAAGIGWELGKRFFGKDVGGVGTTYTILDSGQIISNMLASINGEQPTGITLGIQGVFGPQTVTYLWKRVSDALNELGALAGSYEWYISYTDGTPPTCQLNLVAQQGTDRSKTVFLEYGSGTRHNCKAYSRTRTMDTNATRVWALGNGANLATQAFDTAAETFYRHEDVVTYSGVSSLAILDALAVAHVAVRKLPRLIVNMTPFPKTAPKYGTDWLAGDIVSARVVINQSVRVSGKMRIWGADIAIDELGNETANLRLVPA